MEGDEVNTEVRRVLGSDTGGEMGVAASSGLYLVPRGPVDPERRALLQALAEAEAVRLQPFPPPEVQLRGEAAQSVRLPPQPPYEESIHAWAAPEVIEIRYPDCICRVRRLDFGGGAVAYSVDLADRRFGSDRSYAYRMRIHDSDAVDKAWSRLIVAVERGVAYRHYGGSASSSPLATLRDVGVDYRGLHGDMVLEVGN